MVHMLSVHTILHAFLDLVHFGICTAQYMVLKNMSTRLFAQWFTFGDRRLVDVGVKLGSQHP